MVNYKTKQITYFDNPGIKNTDKAIELASKRAEEKDIKKVVVATSSGKTGLKVIKAFKDKSITIVPVCLNAGSSISDSKEWKTNKREFERLNVKFIQGIQAFSGVERAVNSRWGTAGHAMIIADALRLAGEGFKVGIEIALMACDAGLVSPDDNIITIAGTSSGADTVLVIKPSYSHKLFDLAVNEIICKPFVAGIKHKAR